MKTKPTRPIIGFSSSSNLMPNRLKFQAKVELGEKISAILTDSYAFLVKLEWESMQTKITGQGKIVNFMRNGASD
ncbi:hypothetical protein ABEV38_03735 [Parageobacillus thermoglucosidasius]|uniref:hypothetical protein n=1 Tax=Parageobacillus thermoglucosidasius TaxID=1426 RepID=UPI002686957C